MKNYEKPTFRKVDQSECADIDVPTAASGAWILGVIIFLICTKALS